MNRLLFRVLPLAGTGVARTRSVPTSTNPQLSACFPHFPSGFFNFFGFYFSPGFNRFFRAFKKPGKKKPDSILTDPLHGRAVGNPRESLQFQIASGLDWKSLAIWASKFQSPEPIRGTESSFSSSGQWISGCLQELFTWWDVFGSNHALSVCKSAKHQLCPWLRSDLY